MTAVCVMVLGTSSGAGKSWLATALCRHYANQGLRVAPFKAQNMSNNARVVAGGPSPQPSPQRGEGASPGALMEAGPSPQPFPEGWEGAGTARLHPLPRAGEGRGEGAPSPAGGGLGWGPAPAHAGGEIGSAQYFQALAARAVPDVRMNPLLLKPEADTRSQVVLLGQVSRELSALPWRGRSERVWPQIAAALDALRADNDVVVIEGAGSPAEINLMASDVVNLRVAHHADARCLLVADIDRGGAFAHLYGTWALLPEADRARIRGFVLNKFRGDASLLAPAPEQLRQLTGVPTLAVVPMRFGHGLPEEDGVFDEGASPSPAGGGPGWGPSAPAAPAIGPSPQPSPQRGEGAGTRIATVAHARLSHGAFDEGFPPSPAGGGLGWGPSAPAAPAAGPSPQPPPQRGEGAGTRIAIVAYPRISNLDEFQPLKNLPGVRLCWARSPAALAGADWIILPGSKATAADLAWLRAQGLDAAIARHAARGGAVLGICGGLQMLGEALIDLHGVEPVVAAPSRQSGMGALALGATATNGPGLGLLPLVTSFEPQKTVRRTHARFADVAGPWSPLSGVAVQGYEIHSGQTAQHPAMAAKGDVAREVIPGLAWQSPAGNVLGCYLHGLFEDAAVLHALFGAQAPTLDAVFDGLAAELERAFAPGALQALIAR